MVLPGLVVDNPGSVAAIALPECRGFHGIVFMGLHGGTFCRMWVMQARSRAKALRLSLSL